MNLGHLLQIGFARHVFAWVVFAAVVAALFRVATAPDRIAERRNTARNVCLASGGVWVKVDRDEICQRREVASSKP